MTSTLSLPRLYEDLAGWWPLLSPPSEYAGEAADLLPHLGAPGGTLLELGCGGGSLAFHLKSHFRLTLSDISPGMLAVSRRVNPECEHLQGDMRSLRLDRQFDAVLIHDAIMYATAPADVQGTLETAAIHCRPGGRVVVLPDYVRETFEPGTDHGGHDALLRATDGTVSVEYDRHIEGLSGLGVRSLVDAEGREIFVGVA